MSWTRMNINKENMKTKIIQIAQSVSNGIKYTQKEVAYDFIPDGGILDSEGSKYFFFPKFSISQVDTVPYKDIYDKKINIPTNNHFGYKFETLLHKENDTYSLEHVFYVSEYPLEYTEIQQKAIQFKQEIESRC